MHYINGVWTEGEGEEFYSVSPTLETLVWKGNAPSDQQIDFTVEKSLEAQKKWSHLSLTKRVEALELVVQMFVKNHLLLTEAIAKETGKPYWESSEEAALLPQKFSHSLKAYKERQKATHIHLPSCEVLTFPKALGITSVIGPFNFPMHLPNGHILPSLLAGNTVIFKPSEKTPACAETYLRCFEEAHLPDGVIQLLQGGVKTCQTLISHPAINGVFFTGSRKGGVALSRLLAERPEVLLALEMGGNNPLYIESFSPIEKVVELAIASSFATSGQRCTCARKIFLKEGPEAEKFIQEFVLATKRLTIGIGNAKQDVYLGSLINAEAVDNVLSFSKQMKEKGALVLLDPSRIPNLPKSFITPGILDVSKLPFSSLPDEEIFGPLVQIKKVKDIQEAIKLCNETRYGLAASVVSQNPSSWELFLHYCESGIININSATTGAYSGAAFGGIKKSGNMRPSGYYATDYCCYPCTSQQRTEISGSFLPSFALKESE